MKKRKEVNCPECNGAMTATGESTLIARGRKQYRECQILECADCGKQLVLDDRGEVRAHYDDGVQPVDRFIPKDDEISDFFAETLY